MKQLMETLYILTPDSYVFHRNDNICVSIGGEEKASVPAGRIDAIVFFGKNTLSTSLILFCGNKGITISFLNEYGRIYAAAFSGEPARYLNPADGLHFSDAGGDLVARKFDSKL